MFNDSKIYVAGHSGLLGSALLSKLKAGGYANIITCPRAELDLTNGENVSRFFCQMKPEYVFLSAGKVGGILSNKKYPADYLYTNLAIQNNVFEAAVKHGVKKVVFYGSSCTYPKQCPQPISEDSLLTGAIEPTSQAYATAKIAGIIGCKAYNSQYSNTFICLIPATMYGPGDSFDVENCHVVSALIAKFYKAKLDGSREVTLWGSGQPKREFVYSEDVAEASIFAANNSDKLQNTHYNVGTGKDYSICELASIISSIVGYSGQILWDSSKPDGTARKLLDGSKFSSLGWTPKIDLPEGLQRTFEWFKNHKSQIKFSIAGVN